VRWSGSRPTKKPQTHSPSPPQTFEPTDLQGRRSAKTVYEAQLGLRRFFRFLVREGEIEADPTSNMQLTRYRVDPQPTYSSAKVKRLLLACNIAYLVLKDK